MTAVNTVPKLQFLDLSHYSWPVNWDDLHLNPDLIAVGWKATQGLGNVDQYYYQARKEITDRGYLFCTYHFGDHSDPIKQAAHFLDVAQPDDSTRLALDWEDLRGNQMTRADAEVFIQELDAKTGRLCTIYTGNTAKDLMGGTKSDVLAKHPLWIPRYSALQPFPQASWTDWDVWQYAADGSGSMPNTAHGCTGHPDCNVFRKDVETVKRDWSGKVVAIPVADDNDFTVLAGAAQGAVVKPSIVITVTGDVDVQVVRK